jgi:enoyl-CoA hydratase/carnithine racemase
MILSLYSFPMPTVCWINGHCFGAGWFLAIFHDYRIQNPSRGFLCLPEIDLGAVIPTPLQTIFKQKMSHDAYRTMVLEGVRLPGPAALKLGVVDDLGGLEECLKLIKNRKLVGKTDHGVWGALKEDAYRETLLSIANYQDGVIWRQQLEERKVEEKERALKEIVVFEKGSKL